MLALLYKQTILICKQPFVLKKISFNSFFSHDCQSSILEKLFLQNIEKQTESRENNAHSIACIYQIENVFIELW